MIVYLIAYDLVNKPKEFDYEPLWAELHRLGAHRTQLSLWLVALSNTAKELVEHLSKFVHNDDRLWAIRVHAGDHWYVNAIGGTNTWLERSPPT